MRKIIFVILTLILLIFSLSLLYVIKFEKIEFARAGTGDNIEGFAWSENFGWISFNCTSDTDCSPDYGVNVDPDNNYQFSGYAWSSNIGWISFNENPPNQNFADQCDFPSICKDENNDGAAPYCSACLRTDNSDGNAYKIYGWAKALAIGNDGWISLNGAGYGITIDPASKQFSGWAWNGDESGYIGMGWISFNCSDPSAGGCSGHDYKVSAPTITPPKPTNLSVTPTSCTSVHIDWDDSVNNDYYEVYRENPPHIAGWNPLNPSEGTELLPNLSISEYDNAGLIPPTFPYGQYVYFEVRAHNPFGDSEFSAEASGPTESVCAPGFPVNATTTGFCPNTLRIAWSEEVNAEYYLLSRCQCASITSCGVCDNKDNYLYVKSNDCYNPDSGHCNAGVCSCDDNTIPAGQENDYFRYMVSAVDTGWVLPPGVLNGASSTPTSPPKQPCPNAPTWKEVK